jgi:hypothetical protein
LDVATGIFFPDIQLDMGSSGSFAFSFEICRANSKVIALLYESDDTSLVNIYDRTAINNADHFLLRIFSVIFQIMDRMKFEIINFELVGRNRIAAHFHGRKSADLYWAGCRWKMYDHGVGFWISFYRFVIRRGLKVVIMNFKMLFICLPSDLGIVLNKL